MHEHPLLLRLAMYHFPSGDGYLLGLLVAGLAQLGLIVDREERWPRLLVIAFRLGLIWALAIPSPTPRWLIALFVASVFWLWFEIRRSKSASDDVLQARLEAEILHRSELLAVPSPLNTRTSGTGAPLNFDNVTSARRITRRRWLIIAVVVGAVLCELPYRFAPSVEVSGSRLSIVADSITAGLNDGEHTWPKRLAGTSGWQISDASQAGATLKSARQQLDQLSAEPCVLLLEIGGNDVLAGLPVTQFEEHLEQLLLAARQPGRSVLMFELPLPPLGFRYGEAQRRLATKYGIGLFPKRHLMSVLTTLGSTMDGLHLSPRGHEQMAELVQTLLRGSDSSTDAAGSYEHVGRR